MIHHPVFLQGAPRRAEKKRHKNEEKTMGGGGGLGHIGDDSRDVSGAAATR